MGGGSFADGGCEGADAVVGGDAFAVGDAEFAEFLGDWVVNEDASNDEWAKEVAFAGLIDTEMGLE